MDHACLTCPELVVLVTRHVIGSLGNSVTRELRAGRA